MSLQVYILIAASAFGLMIGTFLNVVVHRLPIMISGEAMKIDDAKAFNLAFPASHCPSCHTPLRPWHNVPLFSYVALRGRCHACGTPISWRYPLIEALTALLFVACVIAFGPTVKTLSAMLLAATLIALATIDIEIKLLPDCLTLPLLWAGLLFNTTGIFVPVASAVYGAVLGYIFFWGLCSAYSRLRGRRAMGEGDFKLAAALGAWFGPESIGLIALCAGCLVLLAAVLFKRLCRSEEQTVPFGPALAVGAGLYLFLFS
ncbi:prepilin peptidase [Herbaspirillum huttiense]|jgi:leader peptidase (prepilin peptidase)/N-methyltransferase|uniref:prepilin peptidase n=1 Tax=Herbaspirillum huttiense TaxID=863372 RepID=UPI00382A0FE2